jgi:hypothetical protein
VEKKFGIDFGKTLKPLQDRKIAAAKRGYYMDFALGVAEMAGAIDAGLTPRLAGDFSLHITEVSLAIQYPDRFGARYQPKSETGIVKPML